MRATGLKAVGSAMTLAGIVFAGSSFAAVMQPTALKNFQEVEASLYRGAQPSEEGFRELAKLGVLTVVDLRGSGGRSSKEAEIVAGLGMKYVNVPLAGFKAPTPEQVSELLGILENQSDGPVFVHCRRGADRTGTILAIYRIEHDHWANEKALDEAKVMKMASSERLMRKLILDYKTSEVAAQTPDSAPAAKSSLPSPSKSAASTVYTRPKA
jgi:tyrosine-protein phosphatase SIW14